MTSATARAYFCETCQEVFWLRGEVDSRMPCPSCRRPSLVLVENPATGLPVTPDVAARAFAAMRQAITKGSEAK